VAKLIRRNKRQEDKLTYKESQTEGSKWQRKTRVRAEHRSLTWIQMHKSLKTCSNLAATEKAEAAFFSSLL